MCKVETLTDSLSWSFNFGLPSGEICVYTIPMVVGSSDEYDIIVNGTGFNWYITYGTDRATNFGLYSLQIDEMWRSQEGLYNYYVIIESTSSQPEFSIYYSKISEKTSDDSSSTNVGAIVGSVVAVVVVIAVVISVVWCVRFRAQNIKKAKEKQEMNIKEEEQRRKLQEEMMSQATMRDEHSTLPPLVIDAPAQAQIASPTEPVQQPMPQPSPRQN